MLQANWSRREMSQFGSIESGHNRKIRQFTKECVFASIYIKLGYKKHKRNHFKIFNMPIIRIKLYQTHK